MLTIWKYPVPIEDTFTLDLPEGARVLAVQEQHSKACLWALVDTTVPIEPRYFRLAGTGHALDGDRDLRWIGTFMQEGGWLVWHLFEVVEA